MWYDSFELFVEKIRKTFKLQKQLLETEMNHDDSDTWKDKKPEWLDC